MISNKRERYVSISRYLTMAAFFFCATVLFAADPAIRFQAQPSGSVVRIQGTSGDHAWTMEGTLIGGFAEFEANVKFDTNQADVTGIKDGKLAATVQASIPVRAIHSKADHLPEVMEKFMQEALKEPQFKKIEYHLTELKLKGPHLAGKPFEFDASGELAIAGVTNKVAFPVSIEYAGADKIKISGVAPLKMTDFGIQPPTLNYGFGEMHCGDNVKISIDWILALKLKN